jgi:hypothetical protein
MSKKFRTNQTLSDAGFNQPSGTGGTLTVSGSTTIANSATLRYSSCQHSTFVNRSVVDKEYVDKHVSGATGSSTYNLSSPAAITVGGISGGTTLTGKTTVQLFEMLLVPTLYPAFVSPLNGFSKTSPAGTLFEVACSQTLNFNASFSRGTITPPYGTSGLRSGLPSFYNYTGAGLPASVGSSSLSDNQNTGAYVTLIGNQSWSSSVTYLIGVQPKDSKGNNYSSPYPAGTTSPISCSIEGVYPLFGTTASITTLTSQPLVSMLTANNVQLNLCADSSPNKQKFEIPCAWLSAPTNRPLTGVLQYNTVSSQWEYPGGSAGASLAIWTTTPAVETIQGNSIGYCQYTYNSTDRSAVCIRLVF